MCVKEYQPKKAKTFQASNSQFYLFYKRLKIRFVSIKVVKSTVEKNI